PADAPRAAADAARGSGDTGGAAQSVLFLRGRSRRLPSRRDPLFFLLQLTAGGRAVARVRPLALAASAAVAARPRNLVVGDGPRVHAGPNPDAPALYAGARAAVRGPDRGRVRRWGDHGSSRSL